MKSKTPRKPKLNERTAVCDAKAERNIEIKEAAERGATLNELATRYGISKQRVSVIIAGRIGPHGGVLASRVSPSQEAGKP